MGDLIRVTTSGLYCEAGDFFIDPWRPVPRALVTHAHSDHARPGSKAYLTALPGRDLVAARTGGMVEGIPYGEPLRMGSTTVSFHPAGHILGSGQIRIECAGEVWVITGDYKTDPDPTCSHFEPIRCDTLITECTFGLPVYRWPSQSEVFEEINQWWREAASEGRTCVLFGYALGKAQRLLAGIDASIGPVRTHGAVEEMNGRYRQAGIHLPDTEAVVGGSRVTPGSMVIAPPGAGNTPWMSRLGDVTTGFASGWMMIRGRRRQQNMDRGFVLSDHVDWPQLMDTVRQTGATRVLPTHGNVEVVSRWLREQGIQAQPLPGSPRRTEEDGS